VLVAFSRRAIYAITGDGPNDQGVGQFSPPRAICKDLGCVDYRSIVQTAAGIFFQSERGLFLIPRGLGAPQFVSMPVEVTQQGYPYCLGALFTADTDMQLLRFVMSTSQYLASSGSQIVLTFDPELNAWAKDTYAQKIQAVGVWDAEPALNNTRAAVFALADLSSSATCGYRESVAITDMSNTTPEAYTALVSTTQLRPFGMCGWGKVDAVLLLTSELSGAPALTYVLGQDGSTTETLNWVGATTNTGQEAYYEARPAKTACTSLTVTLSCTSGRVSWHGIQLSLQPLGERLVQGSTERIS
jgi:hypothetical protein